VPGNQEGQHGAHIIMLTARGEESNVISGLEVSADELLAGLHDRAGNVPELMKLKHRSCCLQQSGYPWPVRH